MTAHEDRHLKRSFLFPVESAQQKETTVYNVDTKTQQVLELAVCFWTLLAWLGH